jgi:hypothetical protein
MKKNEISFYFVFVLMTFIFVGCQEPTLDQSQVKRKKLSAYQLSDFNLAKKVKYFEIAQYIDPSPRSVSQVRTKDRYDISSYNNLSDSNKKKLASLKFVGVDKKSSDRGLRNVFVLSSDLTPHRRKVLSISIAMAPGYANLHYVDQDSKVKIIATRKQLKAFLGEIDTPAEKLLCWYLNMFN